MRFLLKTGRPGRSVLRKKNERTERISKFNIYTTITNMLFDLKRLQEVIKETLSPEEYQAWLVKSQEPDSKEHPCLVEAFFRKEAEKPIELRQKFCMISCNCYKCLPYHM